MMKKLVLLIALLIKFSCVQNRIISFNYVTVPTYVETETTPEENETEKIVAVKNYEDIGSEEYTVDHHNFQEIIKKPCAIVVLSNIQNPNMQSLLRKYRYDANGALIPSSVKYFIKLPQGLRSAPILMPLNDKAFSPLGGFVRYYKEVPPIPQAW